MLLFMVLLVLPVHFICVLSAPDVTKTANACASNPTTGSKSYGSSFGSGSDSATATAHATCDNSTSCGPNQVPSDCANNPCIKNCRTRDLEVECRPSPSDCEPGCLCVDGYLRDNTGVCVPRDKCPPDSQCGDNEEYSECPGQVCRPKKCSENGCSLPCNDISYNNTDCGKPRCICKSGYIRNSIGVCADSKECPSCGGDKNAWSGCGTFCTRCDNYKDKARGCSAACRENACECRPNYVYNQETKKCVLPYQCPNCNMNEEYSKCPNRVCRAKKCSELGCPLPCNQVPTNSTDCGKPACICKSGFVKDASGQCIDSKKCPSCGGDKNAWPGCGTFCTRCDNYKDKARGCSAACRENACECRPNYVYNQKTDKCVLPYQCGNC